MADVNDAKRDGNYVTSMLFVGSDGLTYNAKGDEITGRLYVDMAGGSGTVTQIDQGVGIKLTPDPITTTGEVALADNIAPIATLGTANQLIRVNAGATALEYFTDTGTGDVVGPASATDNAITRFNGTTGKLIQNSGVFITDTPEFVIGNQTALTIAIPAGATIPQIQSIGTTATTGNAIARFANSANAGTFAIAKSRGATVGSYTVVQDGDLLGSIAFSGSDGTDFANGAFIQAAVNGTPGSGDMPTRLIFSTSADGSETPTERMTILASGNVGIGTTSPDRALEINSATGINLRLTYDDSTGSAANYADLLVSSGGSLTITPSGGTATITGLAVATTGFMPDANDGAYLGQAGTAFSDLFLAEGGVINWDSGDATITQTGNILAVAGADFRVATADVGTNADSVPTLSSTSTLTNKTLTAPTIGGVAVLSEGASLRLDTALSADGTWTGTTISGTAGAALAFGDIIYLAVADSRWELADASASSTSGAVLVGICVLAAASDGDPTTILLNGTVRADTAFPTLTVGAPVYVSETAGDVTNTAPTTTDSVTRILGYGIDGNSMVWNPSNDFVTHT